MTKEELFTTIHRAGITPIPVYRDGAVESGLPYFDGSLEGFILACKAIGSTVIFVEDSPLEDWLFFYDPDEEDSKKGYSGREIDLSTVSPALAAYKKYLGENQTFYLTAKGGVGDLCLILDQEWVIEFEKEVQRAQGMAVLGRLPKKGRGAV